MKQIIIAESILRSLDSSDSLFGRGGIAVFSARTSEEILSLHRERKAHLIITDMSLPIMGGARLCSSIRSDASLKDVSIIMAHDGVEKPLLLSRTTGANAVVEQPIDPVELYAKVSELLIVPPRKDIRVHLRITVTGRSGDAAFSALSENISISGMLLETAFRLQQNDRLHCSFFLGHNEVKVEGQVMRVDVAIPGRLRYGIKFMNLDTKTLIIIEQFTGAHRRPDG
jgi:DNA-binding response OmpR family regulator